MLTIFPIKAFNDNYIWVLKKGSNCFIIDPGMASPVLDFLETTNSKLLGILITHHHFDHIGGVKELMDNSSCIAYGIHDKKANFEFIPVLHGQIILLPIFEIQFRILEIPGHTLDHIAFFTDNIPNQPPILFCGDTLFAGGCGRLFEGTYQQFYNSLMSLAKLPDNTQVFCAHEYTETNLRFAATVEPDNQDLQNHIQAIKQLRLAGQPSIPTSLAMEKLTNPFLRCEQPGVIDYAERFVGHSLSDPSEVFAAIRQAKDRFQ